MATFAEPEEPPCAATPKKVALVRGVEDSLECAICMQVVVSPVVTQCGHLFCGGCIQHWLRDRSSHTAKCPTCRESVVGDGLIAVPFVSSLVDRLAVSSPGIRVRNSFDRREAESEARELAASQAAYQVGDVVMVKRFEMTSRSFHEVVGKITSIEKMEIRQFIIDYEEDTRWSKSQDTVLGHDISRRAPVATPAPTSAPLAASPAPRLVRDLALSPHAADVSAPMHTAPDPAARADGSATRIAPSRRTPAPASAAGSLALSQPHTVAPARRDVLRPGATPFAPARAVASARTAATTTVPAEEAEQSFSVGAAVIVASLRGDGPSRLAAVVRASPPNYLHRGVVTYDIEYELSARGRNVEREGRVRASRLRLADPILRRPAATNGASASEPTVTMAVAAAAAVVQVPAPSEPAAESSELERSDGDDGNSIDGGDSDDNSIDGDEGDLDSSYGDDSDDELRQALVASLALVAPVAESASEPAPEATARDAPPPETTVGEATTTALDPIERLAWVRRTQERLASALARSSPRRQQLTQEWMEAVPAAAALPVERHDGDRSDVVVAIAPARNVRLGVASEAAPAEPAARPAASAIMGATAGPVTDAAAEGMTNAASFHVTDAAVAPVTEAAVAPVAGAAFSPVSDAGILNQFGVGRTPDTGRTPRTAIVSQPGWRGAVVGRAVYPGREGDATLVWQAALVAEPPSAFPEAAAAAAALETRFPETKACTACTRHLPSSGFSRGQWFRRSQRRCRDCVNEDL